MVAGSFALRGKVNGGRLFLVGFHVDLPGTVDALAHLVIVDLDVDAIAFGAFFQAFFLGCQMFFIVTVHAEQSPSHDTTSFCF